MMVPAIANDIESLRLEMRSLTVRIDELIERAGGYYAFIRFHRPDWFSWMFRFARRLSNLTGEKLQIERGMPGDIRRQYAYVLSQPVLEIEWQLLYCERKGIALPDSALVEMEQLINSMRHD